MTKKRGLKEPYSSEYESNAYDKDYYDNHEKYYNRAIPYFEEFIRSNFNFESIADIGCGTGAFTLPFERDKKVYGFDFSVGAKVACKLKPENYHVADLSERGSTWVADSDVDIALSLEVYEHIFPEFEMNYLSNVFGIGARFVIISCAVPGQIGRRHVNCKTQDDVIGMIAEYYPSYQLREDLIEKFKTIKYLASFYRNNTLIFDKGE